jgi:hypothetical protein
VATTHQSKENKCMKYVFSLLMKSVFRNIFRKALKIINLMTLERQHASLEIIIRKAKIHGERIVVFFNKTL